MIGHRDRSSWKEKEIKKWTNHFRYVRKYLKKKQYDNESRPLVQKHQLSPDGTK